MAAEQGRSLAETPTWSVATVTTLMVAACFLVERSLSRFAKWLRKTKRKAMLAALEKIREGISIIDAGAIHKLFDRMPHPEKPCLPAELMLLGVISLLLSQTARFISEICVPSSLFTSRFYICSESDYEDLLESAGANQTGLAKTMFGGQLMHVCSEGHEPFVSYEGLEQLHRFLFILGITHVLYSFVTVVLSMIKLVLLVGTELQHVVAQLALEVAEATAPYVGTQLKLRDDLFWFGKPRVLWWLIQFISFQNAFELATFLWSLWELSAQTCFMKHYYMIVIRLISGLLVQFWCSYSTLPLNVIISQMGSKFKKSLVSENVRESLHSWCKRVKDRSRHKPLFSRDGTVTTRSVCSLDTTYETDHETNTVCTLSRTASATSLDDQLTVGTVDDDDEPSCIEKDV
ncbi:MLO-like protein 4 [Dichanthelium oligosanthes]|uniref:MLO-like protein n=1 Tax=Dichanthelium oligosanthes TaxID=888268 RepID=A0A1E5VFU5_9POAL|nr:MLO-like protein 4 [Dichanthelium oligosanthes]